MPRQRSVNRLKNSIDLSTKLIKLSGNTWEFANEAVLENFVWSNLTNLFSLIPLERCHHHQAHVDGELQERGHNGCPHIQPYLNHSIHQNRQAPPRGTHESIAHCVCHDLLSLSESIVPPTTTTTNS